jgi:hypothetical protein
MQFPEFVQTACRIKHDPTKPIAEVDRISVRMHIDQLQGVFFELDQRGVDAVHAGAGNKADVKVAQSIAFVAQ